MFNRNWAPPEPGVWEAPVYKHLVPTGLQSSWSLRDSNHRGPYGTLQSIWFV